MADKQEPIRLRVGTREEPVRFSYVNVFDLRENQNGKPQYSVSVLIPKSYKKQIKEIERCIEEANQRGIAGPWGGKKANSPHPVLRDGDEDYPDKPEYEDMYFIGAKTDKDHKPKVVDLQLHELLDKEEFDSGDYGRVWLEFFPYMHKESKQRGVSVSLGNIQKLKEGTRFAGQGRSAAADFGDDSDADGLD